MKGRDIIRIMEVIEELMDMGGLICLLCDIKYQIVCDCYLRYYVQMFLFFLGLRIIHWAC